MSLCSTSYVNQHLMCVGVPASFVTPPLTGKPDALSLTYVSVRHFLITGHVSVSGKTMASNIRLSVRATARYAADRGG